VHTVETLEIDPLASGVSRVADVQPCWCAILPAMLDFQPKMQAPPAICEEKRFWRHEECRLIFVD
jgi:hypothetical protein